MIAPLIYLLTVLTAFAGKQIFRPDEKNITIIYSIGYLLFGLLNGAVLSPFWRGYSLFLIPVIVGFWQRNKLGNRPVRVALFFLSVAPQLILWTGAWHLDDLYSGLVPSLLIGIVAGYIALYALLSRRQRLGPVIWGGIAFSVLFAFLVPYLFAVEVGKQITQESALVHQPLIDHSGKTFSVSDFKGKIVVLDLWFSGCSVCFKKFPKLEQLSGEWAGKKEVVLATVNVPTPQEAATRTENLKLVEAYHFNKWIVKAETTASTSWDVEGYPCCFVFDKNGVLRYKGILLSERRYLVNNIRDIVARLENE